MTETIYKENTTTKTTGTSFSVGAEVIRTDDRAAANIALLEELIAIINPREKPTVERVRMLNGRLKDYTREEVINAAKGFSKSVWHKENKQMSVDNLLVSSKFGRWYAQASDTKQDPRIIDDDNLTNEQRAKLLKERMG